jgi:hypothetical protein
MGEVHKVMAKVISQKGTCDIERKVGCKLELLC